VGLEQAGVLGLQLEADLQRGAVSGSSSPTGWYSPGRCPSWSFESRLCFEILLYA
jgi:hypothetical protein